MRYSNLATTLVLAGIVSVSQAFKGVSFLDIGPKFAESLQSANITSPRFDVTYNLKTGKVGTFKIGGNNDTISMRPQLNLDYSIIASSNCTECPSHSYNVAASEKLNYLKRTSDTKSIELSIPNSSFSLVVNGTWVEDVFSTSDDTAHKAVFNLTERYEFFLLHNYTAGEFQQGNIKAMME